MMNPQIAQITQIYSNDERQLRTAVILQEKGFFSMSLRAEGTEAWQSFEAIAAKRFYAMTWEESATGKANPKAKIQNHSRTTEDDDEDENEDDWPLTRETS